VITELSEFRTTPRHSACFACRNLSSEPLDLWDALKKRLNTTHVAHGGSVEINSLTGAHACSLNQRCPRYTIPQYDNQQLFGVESVAVLATFVAIVRTEVA